MKRSSFVYLVTLLVLAFPVAIGLAQEAPAPAVGEYTELVPNELGPGDATPFRGEAGPGDRQAVRRMSGASGSRSLTVGFSEPLFVSTNAAARQAALRQAAAVNAKAARLQLDWSAIAPASKPAGFNPRDPGSPYYSWGHYDAAIREARARGLRVILMIYRAPDWAEGPNRASSAPRGTWKPDPGDVADFGAAISKRYSGSFGSLPRVRDFMLWNEPNLPAWLTPQLAGGKLFSPGHYRRMLNAFYREVHAVRRSNSVITAGTAPYGGGSLYGDARTRPLAFWRKVMCVKGHGRRTRGTKCPQKPKFDVLAHHPINTSGGPHKSAINPDDVSIPDVHNLVDVLRAAERARNIGTGGRHPVWATEFWWESNPPDPYKSNPSLARQAEWYQEALYLLWKQGVSLALPYQVRDEPHYGPPGPFPGSSYETGVYFANGQPKPSSRAIRFPFVAERKSRTQVLLWGIAPSSGRVTVTQKGKGPRRVSSFKVKRGKVFTESVRLRGRHVLRARVGKVKSLNWSLK